MKYYTVSNTYLSLVDSSGFLTPIREQKISVQKLRSHFQLSKKDAMIVVDNEAVALLLMSCLLEAHHVQKHSMGKDIRFVGVPVVYGFESCYLSGEDENLEAKHLLYYMDKNTLPFWDGSVFAFGWEFERKRLQEKIDHVFSEYPGVVKIRLVQPLNVLEPSEAIYPSAQGVVLKVNFKKPITVEVDPGYDADDSSEDEAEQAIYQDGWACRIL